jgi:hypothetical protein
MKHAVQTSARGLLQSTRQNLRLVETEGHTGACHSEHVRDMSQRSARSDGGSRMDGPPLALERDANKEAVQFMRNRSLPLALAVSFSCLFACGGERTHQDSIETISASTIAALAPGASYDVRLDHPITLKLEPRFDFSRVVIAVDDKESITAEAALELSRIDLDHQQGLNLLPPHSRAPSPAATGPQADEIGQTSQALSGCTFSQHIVMCCILGTCCLSCDVEGTTCFQAP